VKIGATLSVCFIVDTVQVVPFVLKILIFFLGIGRGETCCPSSRPLVDCFWNRSDGTGEDSADDICERYGEAKDCTFADGGDKTARSYQVDMACVP